MVQEQNQKMLASVAAVLGGTVMEASTVVDVIGASYVKVAKPDLVSCWVMTARNIPFGYRLKSWKKQKLHGNLIVLPFFHPVLQ